MKKYRSLGVLAIIGIIFLFSGVVQADLNNGLVAYYPFNGNANDESGNGNDGAINGATLAEDRFWNANSAFSFDGINDYIEIDNAPELDFGMGDFSIALWIKSEACAMQMIIQKNGRTGSESS